MGGRPIEGSMRREIRFRPVSFERELSLEQNTFANEPSHESTPSTIWEVGLQAFVLQRSTTISGSRMLSSFPEMRPVEQCAQSGAECLSYAGELVLDLGRHLWVDGASHHPITFQRA